MLTNSSFTHLDTSLDSTLLTTGRRVPLLHCQKKSFDVLRLKKIVLHQLLLTLLARNTTGPLSAGPDIFLVTFGVVGSIAHVAE